MSEGTGSMVDCPVCGEPFDPTDAGGWCTNPECGEWRHEGGDTGAEDEETGDASTSDAADPATGDDPAEADEEVGAADAALDEERPGEAEDDADAAREASADETPGGTADGPLTEQEPDAEESESDAEGGGVDTATEADTGAEPAEPEQPEGEEQEQPEQPEVDDREETGERDVEEMETGESEEGTSEEEEPAEPDEATPEEPGEAQPEGEATEEAEPEDEEAAGEAGEEGAQFPCPDCGASLDADVNFCPDCGADVSELPGEGPTCPECGTDVDEDDNFCASCGADLTGPESLTECPECGTGVEDDDVYCASCGEHLEPHRGASESAEEEAEPGDGAAAEEPAGTPEEPVPDQLTLSARGREIRVGDGDAVGRQVRRIIMETDGDEDEAVRVHREHVRFVREDGGFYVVDLGDNPTVVNGEHMEKGDRRPIGPGDELGLSGVVTLRVGRP